MGRGSRASDQAITTGLCSGVPRRSTPSDRQLKREARKTAKRMAKRRERYMAIPAVLAYEDFPYLPDTYLLVRAEKFPSQSFAVERHQETGFGDHVQVVAYGKNVEEACEALFQEELRIEAAFGPNNPFEDLAGLDDVLGQAIARPAPPVQSLSLSERLKNIDDAMYLYVLPRQVKTRASDTQVLVEEFHENDVVRSKVFEGTDSSAISECAIAWQASAQQRYDAELDLAKTRRYYDVMTEIAQREGIEAQRLSASTPTPADSGRATSSRNALDSLLDEHEPAAAAASGAGIEPGPLVFSFEGERYEFALTGDDRELAVQCLRDLIDRRKAQRAEALATANALNETLKANTRAQTLAA